MSYFSHLHEQRDIKSQELQTEVDNSLLEAYNGEKYVIMGWAGSCDSQSNVTAILQDWALNP